jgi:hypothetical protein
MKLARRIFATTPRIVAAVALVAAAGCYKYVPSEGGAASLVRGAQVRVSLSRPMAVDLGEITVNDAVVISGDFIALQDDGSILLSAFETRSAAGAERGGIGETVTIPADAIAGVERRVFNGVGTVLVAIPIVGGAVAIGVAAVGDGAGGGGNGGNGPPTPE